MKLWGLLLLTIIVLGHYTSCLPITKDNEEEELKTLIKRILNEISLEDEVQSAEMTEDPFESEVVLQENGQAPGDTAEEAFENELFNAGENEEVSEINKGEKDNEEKEMKTLIRLILNEINRQDEEQSGEKTEDPFESEVVLQDSGKTTGTTLEEAFNNQLFKELSNTGNGLGGVRKSKENEKDSDSDSKMNYQDRIMQAAQQLNQNPSQNSLDLQKANLIKSIKERLDEIEYKRYVDNLKPGDLHEGDILVDKDLIDRLRGTDMDERQFVISRRKKWRKTGANVIIRYVDSTADEGAKKIFEKAIKWINQLTCVNIVKLSQPFPNYINLTSDSTKPCMSRIGKQGGAQILNLRSSCQNKGTAIHEILHALGFFHEQSRCDRDLYVNIFQQNIRPAARSQFRCIQGLKTFGVPYNSKSIMHYRNTEFSKNGKSTVQSKSHPSLQLGNEDLSDLDVLAINKAFYCPLDKYAVAVYNIQVKTKGGFFDFGAGTDSDVDLLIVFDNNKEFDGILIKGEGDALEKGSVTNRQIVLPAEGNIKKVVARVVTDTAFGDWKPEWVKITVRITVQTSSSTKQLTCYFPDGTDIEYEQTAETQWCGRTQ